jgi:hypothetical protein
MRWVPRCLMAIIAACIITVGLNTVSAMLEDISDLKELVPNGDKPGLCDEEFNLAFLYLN